MAEQFYRANILVCGVAGCAASGSQEVIKALEAEIQRRGLQKEVNVIQSGCRGFCAIGPIMTIYPEGIFYCQVTAGDVPLIVEETLIKGRVVERLIYKEPANQKALPHYKDIPFYNKQTHHALRNCGMIDPERIDEYIAQDGYTALAKALTEMTPRQVIDEVKRAGSARRRRRRISGRREMGVCRQCPRSHQVCHLQRRRRGPWRVHGPVDSGR